MLTETFRSIAAAARIVIRNWQSLVLIAVVYASLLAVLYFFVIIKEATFFQVSLTFASAIAAPVLFFILQAMIANGPASSTTETSGRNELTAGSMIKRSLTSFWKLLLITLPLIGLAILIAYLLAKAQARFGASLETPALDLPRRAGALANARDSARPVDWRAAILSTLRYLSFGLVLPLAAVHLWLATAQEGLFSAIKRIGTHLSRAFAPQSVLIYLVGFLIFGVAPYFLMFKTTTSKHAWLELSLLVGRLVVVFALTLLGWMITVKALAVFAQNPPNEQANEAA